ncbi:hypothetical protein [Syntrophomonas wolfei]|uniref:Uncharacterized protein n=1 Tax=Syntrophomonas wolfei subsp. wolfei (strain DSM 2245B / Goettingen) TaxID=335541 RepID=Q0AUR4_SYNWW|nr:hypothetical protein [Syntrophomonas wolfei]ABI69540.1 hypothetical protein Swol_2249 [Syntrophomonas wolfei subsp. wolfei str. Goettingen G311]
MHYQPEELAILRENLNSDVREIDEAGYCFIYIPGLNMPPGCAPEKTDALLCPMPHSGYTSRLFFKDRIQTVKQVNWNGEVFVLGHKWYAFSYQNIENMPMLDMVINHLRGLVA